MNKTSGKILKIREKFECLAGELIMRECIFTIFGRETWYSYMFPAKPLACSIHTHTNSVNRRNELQDVYPVLRYLSTFWQQPMYSKRSHLVHSANRSRSRLCFLVNVLRELTVRHQFAGFRNGQAEEQRSGAVFPSPSLIWRSAWCFTRSWAMSSFSQRTA